MLLDCFSLSFADLRESHCCTPIFNFNDNMTILTNLRRNGKSSAEFVILFKRIRKFVQVD